MKLKALILVFAVLYTPAYCERIKDIVDIQGVRGNPLTGKGLVVGLAGTGDTGELSKQMLSNVLRDGGVVLSTDELSTGNVAVVLVTAELPPFGREGALIDIDVASIGDAKSLQGGLLLPTPLKGMDGQVYAVTNAAGVSLAGWTVSGATGSSIAKNHQTLGHIPAGARIERSEIAEFVEQIAGNRIVTLNLRNNDFATANEISRAINSLHVNSAVAVDAGTVRVRVPDGVTQSQVVVFMEQILSPQVKVDTPAVVVVNERTGTIVVGEHVGISAVAVSQGSLVVKIQETNYVSQPSTPFTDGATTEVVPESILDVEEKQGALIPIPASVTVSELANYLNAIGATPRDLIAIFNALKKAGALQARLEIM